MGEEDVVEVAVPTETRGNASRSGRVTQPPKRLEQELSQATPVKQNRATNTSKKTTQDAVEDRTQLRQDVGEQLQVILQLLHQQAQDAKKQADHVNKQLEEQDKKHEMISCALEKYMQENRTEIAAIRMVQDQFAARLQTVEQGLSELRESLKGLSIEVTATRKSYADAVRTGTQAQTPSSSGVATSQGTPITQVCSISPSSSASQPQLPASPHVTIGVSAAKRRTEIVAEKPGTVRKRIDEALAELEETKSVKCWGISRNPRDNNKFKVFFKDQAEVELVRRCTGWMNGYFQETRLQAEQWYPVRVDSVYKEAVLEDVASDKVKSGVAQTIERENDVQIHKIQWLSKPGTEKVHGSMVLYLVKREQAERLVQGGRVEIEGETAFARPYQRRSGPRRCYKCHQFGHVAAACSSPEPVCSRCAEAGHKQQTCSSDRVRCVGCGGPHSTFDTNCRIYKMACEQVQPRQS